MDIRRELDDGSSVSWISPKNASHAEMVAEKIHICCRAVRLLVNSRRSLE